MKDASITLRADAGTLLDMAARTASEELCKRMRALASELIASAHAEAEVIDDPAERDLKVA